jgi:hemolysin III
MRLGRLDSEEIANVLTHGVGLFMSAAGATALVVVAALNGDPWRLTGAAVYGATLLLLYGASTLYHGTDHPEKKERFRLFDHCAIYLLIAGTYTPFVLVGLGGTWGWLVFGAVWAMAAAGILFKCRCWGRFPRLSTAIYIGMGWMGVFFLAPLLRVMTVGTLLWLLAGGLAYTFGTIFYHRDERIRYGHALWHLFVLAGSACHFVAVVLLLLPPAAA